MIQDFFQILLQVPDLDTVEHAYRHWLGFRTADSGRVSAGQAAHWRAPELSGARFVLLQPESGAPSFLCFVEGAAVPPPGTLGWNGIELHVRQLDAVAQALIGSPFTEFSPPQALSLSPKVRLMQVLGPAGELLFLNEMGDPAFGVGHAASDVDRPFVMTCGARDLDAMLRWVRNTLALEVGPPIQVTMPALNRVFGFPEGTQHPLGMVKFHGPCIVEFDGYPAQAPARPRGPGGMPLGIGLVSCSVSGFGALAAADEAIVIDHPPYNGARALLLEAPEGVLIELVERDSGLSQ